MDVLAQYSSDSDAESGDEQQKISENTLQDQDNSQEPAPPEEPLVEPRPPRRQSDMYDDDDEPEEGEAQADEEDREDDELDSLLLQAGMEMEANNRLLLVNQSGASTPGGAGYTPRSSAWQEEALLGEQDEQQRRIPIEVPPSPPGQCDPELQARFNEYFRRKELGMDMHAQIKRRRDFKNPSLYEWLVDKFGIDEKGTNFPATVYDPNNFLSEDFYDKLGDHQAALEAKRKQQHNYQSVVNEQAQSSATGSGGKRPTSLPASKEVPSTTTTVGSRKQPAPHAAAGRRTRFEIIKTRKQQL